MTQPQGQPEKPGPDAGAAPEQPAPPPSAPAQPSLQEVLARQRAELTNRLAEKQAASSKPAATGSPAAGSAPGAEVDAAGVLEAVNGKSSLLRRLLMISAVALLVGGSSAVIGLFLRGGHETPPPPLPPKLVQIQIPYEPLPASEPAPTTLVAAASAPATEPQEPRAASWDAAEKFLADGEYREAISLYQILLERLEPTPANGAVCDLLRLRQAQCLERLGQGKPALTLYRSILASRSPLVRGAANYALAVHEAAGGDRLQARIRAYMALAALEGAETPTGLIDDCDFLVAAALSDRVESLANRSPSIDWRQGRQSDPFLGQSEPAVRRMLRRGSAKLDEAAMAPQVKRAKLAAGRRWSVFCRQASLEEVLSRFATEAGLELKWSGISPAARRRAIDLLIDEATEQRVAEIACGSCSLIARFTGEAIIVQDSAAAESLSQQRDMLRDEAISAWRRFFLRSPEDPRVASGHLSLGGLYELASDLQSAMQEYRLVPARFEKSPAAPAALLRQARLQVQMLDHAGARQSLLDLLDRYPDQGAAGEVYLELALASMNSNRLDESAVLFRKLYHLELTPESRRKACLGAGMCYSRNGQHMEAAAWLERYFKAPGEGSLAEGLEARLLYGRALRATNRAQAAVAVLAQAATPEAPPRVRAEALLELAAAQTELKLLGSAAGTLAQLEQEVLTPEQLCQYLVTLGQACRAMGLPRRAVPVLRKRAADVAAPELRALISLELARCYAADDDLSSACQLVTDVLAEHKPGPEAQQAACDLADMCLRNGQPHRAAAVAQEVLRSPQDETIRRRASAALGQALLEQKEYDKAVAAFSAALPERGGGP